MSIQEKVIAGIVAFLVAFGLSGCGIRMDAYYYGKTAIDNRDTSPDHPSFSGLLNGQGRAKY